jgi:hypothetical protein
MQVPMGVRGGQPNVRNPGMQQIPPSGPMMRHQVPFYLSLFFITQVTGIRYRYVVNV